MTIRHDEEWIQIAYLDHQDQMRFTRDFQNLMGDLGWEAKAFVGHLLGLWYDSFEHMLDFNSGDAKFTADQPGEYDQNWLDKPQEIVEYWAVRWSQNDQSVKPVHEAGTGMPLDVEWYRDVLRAKLVSLRLPKRLLVEYRHKVLDQLHSYGIDLDIN